MATTTTPTLTAAEVRWVLALAARAPSVHNTQPWRYEWTGAGFRLLADTHRGLSAIDPTGRELAISCGAALYNLRVALRQLDRDAQVRLAPDPAEPRLLAAVGVTTGEPSTTEERRRLSAMQRRHTRRGDFTGSALDPALEVALIRAAEAEGGHLLFVTESGRHASILRLARAADWTAIEPNVEAETEAWTPGPDSDRPDGVPSWAYSDHPRSNAQDALPPRDFDLGRGYATRADGHRASGPIAALVTDGDLLVDWLRAGMALEAVLVTAAESWAFASLSSRVCEVPGLRAELRRALGTAAHPHLLMQFGHADTVAPTPRRSVDDIIDLDAET